MFLSFKITLVISIDIVKIFQMKGTMWKAGLPLLLAVWAAPSPSRGFIPRHTTRLTLNLFLPGAAQRLWGGQGAVHWYQADALGSSQHQPLYLSQDRGHQLIGYQHGKNLFSNWFHHSPL